MRKATGKVVNAKGNGGFHKLRAYRDAAAMIRNHDYTSARLYHLCLTGSNTREPYLDAVKALSAHLRKETTKKKGIRCQYKAALEVSAKGELHMHVFFLVEAAFANPDHILNRKSGEWLDVMLLKKGLSFYINPPRGALHYTKAGESKNYASVPLTKGIIVDDCCTWIEYIYKLRDKPKSGPVYFSSRPGREIKPEDREPVAA